MDSNIKTPPDLSALRKRYPQNFPIPPDELDGKKLKLILERELIAWKLVASPLPENPSQTRVELFREYVFKSFDQVLEYMSKVAPICNTLPHHPRWENTWTTLKIYLSTWDSNHIISYKDIMLARHMENIFKDYGETYVNVHATKRKERELGAFLTHIESLKENGELGEAFKKLNQYLSQPQDIDQRKAIESIISEYDTFTDPAVQKDLTEDDVSKKTIYFKMKLSEIVKSIKFFKPKVFFSYAWGGEREKIVDDLYESLRKDEGYEVVRDKVDLGYKGLISEFMKGIGRGNFVVIALSDKYLRSEYCMFELYELYRNSSLDSSELLKKIYPIRVENLDLNSTTVLRDYFTYWKDLEVEWKGLVTDFDADQKKYRRIQAIRTSISDLLPFLNDINSKTKDILSENDFLEIKNAIKARVVDQTLS
jgi:pterin-4a-carbinolamine dehydratase